MLGHGFLHFLLKKYAKNRRQRFLWPGLPKKTTMVSEQVAADCVGERCAAFLKGLSPGWAVGLTYRRFAPLLT
ncbi:MAG: hypothetical protein ACOCVG_01630, partial [Verrucomicrobiota bacterium]